jgi:hypothetical protein
VILLRRGMGLPRASVDGLGQPPTITSADTKSQEENATLSHVLTANQVVTWSIVGGADQSKFEISGSTLRWAGNGTKDYDSPDDFDANNTYVVIVRATNGFGQTEDQTITVTVTDVADDPLDGLSGVTGAWSVARRLRSSYGGARYNLTSSVIDTLYDQSGNNRDMVQATAGRRPAVVTVGANNREAADFDGTDDRLASTATLADVADNNRFYIIVVAQIDAFLNNNTGSSISQNSPIIADTGGFAGVVARGSGSSGFVSGYNWDGNSDVAERAISTDALFMFSVRHEGGELITRINGGSESSPVASGNTTTLTNAMHMGATSASTFKLNGKIAEVIIFDVPPNSTTRDDLEANVKAFYGL